MYFNITAKQLKMTSDIHADSLASIWNIEVVKEPSDLKLANIKLQSTL